MLRCCNICRKANEDSKFHESGKTIMTFHEPMPT